MTRMMEMDVSMSLGKLARSRVGIIYPERPCSCTVVLEDAALGFISSECSIGAAAGRIWRPLPVLYLPGIQTTPVLWQQHPTKGQKRCAPKV